GLRERSGGDEKTENDESSAHICSCRADRERYHRRMRIFQILEFNQFDTGSVHQMFQAAVGLRERGHDGTIVSRPGAALQSKAEEHGVRFEGLPMRNAFDVVSARRLARLLRGADVVHVHKGVAHSLALMATLASPVGAFVVNRGVSFPLDRWNGAKFRTRR